MAEYIAGGPTGEGERNGGGGDAGINQMAKMMRGMAGGGGGGNNQGGAATEESPKVRIGLDEETGQLLGLVIVIPVERFQPGFVLHQFGTVIAINVETHPRVNIAKVNQFWRHVFWWFVPTLVAHSVKGDPGERLTLDNHGAYRHLYGTARFYNLGFLQTIRFRKEHHNLQTVGTQQRTEIRRS